MTMKTTMPKTGHKVILPLAVGAAMGLLPLVSALPSVAQTIAKDSTAQVAVAKHDTTSSLSQKTVTVGVGDSVKGIGKVTCIDTNGVELYVNEGHYLLFYYGEPRSKTTALLTTRVIAEKGMAPSTAVLEIAQGKPGSLPPVPASPPVAQTVQPNAGPGVKDTTKKKTTSVERFLFAPLVVVQAKANAPAKDGLSTKENVVARDTVRLPIMPTNAPVVTQISKPTAVEVGDVIAQMKIEYFAEMAGYFMTSWKVTKIDARGIEVSPAHMEMFMSEHASSDSMPACRIDYGRADTVGSFSNPAYGPVMSIRIDAKKGKTEGTAILTAVNIPPVKYYRETKAVKVGSDAGPFGKITKIDAKGAEFSDNGRLDYGQVCRLGEYIISESITVERGRAPGTAILYITRPIMPGDSLQK